MDDDVIEYIIGQLRGACWEEEAAAVEALVKERDGYKDAAKTWQEVFIQENTRLVDALLKLDKAMEALNTAQVAIMENANDVVWRLWAENTVADIRTVLAKLEVGDEAAGTAWRGRE
jgi:uncharacterized Fe-S cluster-containing protein